MDERGHKANRKNENKKFLGFSKKYILRRDEIEALFDEYKNYHFLDDNDQAIVEFQSLGLSRADGEITRDYILKVFANKMFLFELSMVFYEGYEDYEVCSNLQSVQNMNFDVFIGALYRSGNLKGGDESQRLENIRDKERQKIREREEEYG